MDSWAKDSGGAGRIEFLSDGNGDFARAIGLDRDLSSGGMGLRSQRYSMLVDDGVVVSLNVEEKPGSTELSGAAKILADL
jgi:peroxiredoxin